ncbi:MAG: hypothetical protein AAF961_19165 [Planctomycetota bacterium]
MNGVSVNDVPVLHAEGPRYRYYDHHVDVPDPSILRTGEHRVATGKSPLHGGILVQGMEVNLPGIQLLVQFRAE